MSILPTISAFLALFTLLMLSFPTDPATFDLAILRLVLKLQQSAPKIAKWIEEVWTTLLGVVSLLSFAIIGAILLYFLLVFLGVIWTPRERRKRNIIKQMEYRESQLTELDERTGTLQNLTFHTPPHPSPSLSEHSWELQEFRSSSSPVLRHRTFTPLALLPLRKYLPPPSEPSPSPSRYIKTEFSTDSRLSSPTSHYIKTEFSIDSPLSSPASRSHHSLDYFSREREREANYTLSPCPTSYHKTSESYPTPPSPPTRLVTHPPQSEHTPFPKFKTPGNFFIITPSLTRDRIEYLRASPESSTQSHGSHKISHQPHKTTKMPPLGSKISLPTPLVWGRGVAKKSQYSPPPITSGTLVLRRRPSSTFQLLASSPDTHDLWDGPFMVLSVHPVKHTAKLEFPPDTTAKTTVYDLQELKVYEEGKITKEDLKCAAGGYGGVYTVDKIRGERVKEVVKKGWGRSKKGAGKGGEDGDKMRKREMEYLVSWMGYPSEDDCWEPAENIVSPEVMEAWEKVKREWVMKNRLMVPVEGTKQVETPQPVKRKLIGSVKEGKMGAGEWENGWPY